MKLRFFLAAALLFGSLPAFSCDACGCSLSQAYWGLMPANSRHYVGVWWQHQRYRSYFEQDIYPEQGGAPEFFNSFELRGRYRLSPRLQLVAILPYAYNLRGQAGAHPTIQGIGDMVAMGSYTLFDNSDSLASAVRHRLSVGVGVKAPSGRYRRQEPFDLSNPNFQLGSGSWDVLFNLNYTARWGKSGFNLDGTYRRNNVNKEDYRFGNRLNGAATLFWLGGNGVLEIMPNAGLLYEQAAWDVEDGYYHTNTGGKALFAGLGLELYWGRFNIGANWYAPLAQDLSAGLLKARERGALHFNFFF